MDHHLGRPAAHLAGLDGALERLEPVLEDDVLRHPHLDADQEVLVLRQRHGAGFDLRIVDIVEFGDRERGQAVVGDVDEGIDPRPRLRHDVATQRREIVDAGIARRDHGGGALELHQFVGGNADRRAVGVDMAMQIDEARGHELASGIDGLQGAGGRNLRLDRLDHAPADADIALALERLAGIEHVAALDHQIELVVRPHRRMGLLRETSDGGSSRQRKEIATRQSGHGALPKGCVDRSCARDRLSASRRFDAGRLIFAGQCRCEDGKWPCRCAGTARDL